MPLPRLLGLTIPALALASATAADVPDVVTDTAPVQSLVAMVMGDLGRPVQLIPAGTSPHHAELRPADAAALAGADLVIWTGPDFLPRIGDAIASLAPQATTLPLLDTGGWTPLTLRAGHHHDEHGHEHGLAHGEGDGLGGGALDPHAWLDPAVAATWVGSIEAALATADPGNADLYAANAESARRELAALSVEIADLGARVDARRVAVGHDAYAYFERAAGLPPSLPLGLSDGGEPRAADAAALADAVEAGDLSCLVLDAETGDGWSEALGLRTVRADPDGVHIDPGPDLYPALIRDVARAFNDCLAT